MALVLKRLEWAVAIYPTTELVKDQVRAVAKFTEKDGALGDYEIDLAALLRRGVGLAWNEKLGMLTINGIGKYHRVHASEIFGDDDCGMILETQGSPHLRLYQDGDSTPVSDLMGRQNHVSTVVPRAAVQEEIDWRLPVFESGKYLVAFDGAALLLRELWRRGPEGGRG